MRERERKAYVCTEKDGTIHKRVFLLPGDPEPPTCEVHGRMSRQTNLPFGAKRRKKGK